MAHRYHCRLDRQSINGASTWNTEQTSSPKHPYVYPHRLLVKADFRLKGIKFGLSMPGREILLLHELLKGAFEKECDKALLTVMWTWMQSLHFYKFSPAAISIMIAAYLRAHPSTGISLEDKLKHCFRYGVSFSDSDLDLVVLDPERVSGFEVKECITLPSPSIYYLRRLRRALEKAGFTKIESVARAAVPIVKFKDPRTGLECDLNVNERLGLVNSDLLKTYCDISPLLRPMLFKIKEWAKPLGLNRPSSPPGEPASFSSYALALMTIAFLQSRELLPNLQANLPPLDPAVPGSAVWTRRGEKCDVRYHHNVNNWQPKTDPLLEEVMTDWFSYWHRGFNYAEQEISIRDGGLRTKLSPKESSEPGWMPNGINVFDPFIVSKCPLRLSTLDTMKSTAIFTSLALLPAALAVTLSYDSTYDNSGGSLATVACSDGPNGLLTAGYTTFGSLPSFPYIGGAAAVSGWNSPNCGTCWQLTYTNSKGAVTSINVLAVDHTNAGFNIALSAMNQLTGGQAVQLGRIDVTATQVASSVCGL
ncbi:hypothetical protein H0H81_011222 [Sphagnurus paluster]|uniref:Poly(A) RNA polymerase mitochondrial-like central palm domain-containing protein n=1 Tax=Sphagnurus paluster TaxID=117069 RepID=A0A9P7GIM6_9AGAR|nr:hypothetical protein H0H81_011222 [Sphagnurus paluster]